jgi:hypothetical protein
LNKSFSRQVSDGVSAETQLAHGGSAAQTFASLQHDAVMHASQAALPVVRESVQLLLSYTR